jgi:hypothetical protein
MTNSNRGRHPTSMMFTCCGDVEPIDVEMVPIMQALWPGIHTQGCCQGDDDQPAQICFPDVEEADKFCRRLLDAGASPNRVAGAHMDDAGGVWRWDLMVRFPIASRGLLSLTFPRSDLPLVERWLTDPTEERPGNHEGGAFVIWVPDSDR